MSVNRLDSSIGGEVIMQTLVVVGARDLRFMELTCSTCKTAFTFAMESSAFFPEKCPCCPATWDGFTDKRLENAFKCLKEFYSVFKESRFNARFRVPEVSGTPVAENK